MIRPAAPSDLTRLFALVMELYRRSEFPERGCQVNEALVRSVLMDGVRRHGSQHAGSTLLNVVEFRGTVEGFMMGLLQPLYAIGVDLEAQDFWLFCTDKAPKIATGLLIDAYVAWAESNAKVKDILLSWTDAAGVDGQRLARVYQRKGFRRRGEIFVRGQ